MTDTLAPFVFKKVSLAHLGISTKEIILKFRRSTYVDNESLRAKYNGTEEMIKAFQDPVLIAKTLFGFLTHKSLDEINALQIIKRDMETGAPADSPYTLKEKFLMLFVSSEETNKELYTLFLHVFGYGKKQVDILMGIVDSDKEETEKKTQKAIPKKKS